MTLSFSLSECQGFYLKPTPIKEKHFFQAKNLVRASNTWFIWFIGWLAYFIESILVKVYSCCCILLERQALIWIYFPIKVS